MWRTGHGPGRGESETQVARRLGTSLRRERKLESQAAQALRVAAAAGRCGQAPVPVSVSSGLLAGAPPDVLQDLTRGAEGSPAAQTGTSSPASGQLSQPKAAGSGGSKSGTHPGDHDPEELAADAAHCWIGLPVAASPPRRTGCRRSDVGCFAQVSGPDPRRDEPAAPPGRLGARRDGGRRWLSRCSERRRISGTAADAAAVPAVHPPRPKPPVLSSRWPVGWQPVRQRARHPRLIAVRNLKSREIWPPRWPHTVARTPTGTRAAHAGSAGSSRAEGTWRVRSPRILALTNAATRRPRSASAFCSPNAAASPGRWTPSNGLTAAATRPARSIEPSCSRSRATFAARPPHSIAPISAETPK